MGFQHTPGLAAENGRKGKRGPSRINVEAAEIITNLTQRLYVSVMNNWQDLETKDQAMLLAKLMDYILPKKRSVESRISIDNLPNEDIEELWNRMLKEQQ